MAFYKNSLNNSITSERSLNTSPELRRKYDTAPKRFVCKSTDVQTNVHHTDCSKAIPNYQGSHRELTKEGGLSERTRDAQVDDPGLKEVTRTVSE
ncbi:hypothetical protein TNCV_962351 [Trichonephila clavipes]|nr:hypothetical protein TNCV_962351 [Trichonephila clavipes]